MDSFVEELLDRINCATVLEFPIGSVTITLKESVVISWGIIVVVALLSFLLTRHLSVDKPGKAQLLLESLIAWLENMFDGLLGERGKRYTPYMITVIIYIGFANLSPLLGFKPPTKDLNVTAALALMSIVLIEYAGIRANGIGGWTKSFAKPIAIMVPINILEVFIRPLSLCMRLFGNIAGGFVIMELINCLCKFVIPVPFSMFFDVFDGLIQAYIFCMLTSLFTSEQIGEEEPPRRRRKAKKAQPIKTA